MKKHLKIMQTRSVMENDRKQRLSMRVYNHRKSNNNRRYQRSRYKFNKIAYRHRERSRSKERTKHSYERKTNSEVITNNVKPSSSTSIELKSEEISTKTEGKKHRNESKKHGTKQYKEMEIYREHIRARYVYSQNESRCKMNTKEYRRKRDRDRNVRDDSTGDNKYNGDRRRMEVCRRQTFAKINNEERNYRTNKPYGEFQENRRPDRENNVQIMRSRLNRRMNERKKWNEKHWTEKEIYEMNERDWNTVREENDIIVTGDNIPLPIRSWNESELHRGIMRTLWNRDYKMPTPIQMQAIPIGLQNRDIVGVAEMGSGKTLAYLIPLLNWLIELPIIRRISYGKNGPSALILAPTGELAWQIANETNKFGIHLGIRTLLVIGGMSREQYYFHLTLCDIIVATPGIVMDILQKRYMDLKQCMYVILDEADKILQQEFASTVESIFSYLPVSNVRTQAEIDTPKKWNNYQNVFRRIVMFTANMSSDVENIAKKYLQSPAVVYAGTRGPPIERIEQIVHIIHENNKFSRLMEYLSGFKPPIIIFVCRKKHADILATELRSFQYNACAFHSDMSLAERNYAMANFRAGHIDILVTTDINGRGIDIINVSLVVNFDMAYSIEDYMHRIGRTGRAGKYGVAVTFCTNNDGHLLDELRDIVMSSPIHRWIQDLSRSE